MKLFCLFLLFSLPLLSREWTANDGRKLQADFVSTSADKVTLKRDSDGKTFTIPIKRLSEKDQAWIKEHAKKPPERKAVEGPYAHLLTGKWELSKEDDLPYAIYGKEIDANQQYPLVIGLHGKSNNNTNGKQTGIIRYFSQDARYQKNPAILLAPLCYQPYGGTGGGWGDKPGEQVIKLTKKLLKELPIDPKRVYLYGFSMGGGGTVSLITEEPKLFAAGIVIAGWSSGSATKVFKKVPVWAFHGSADTIVKPDSIRALADDLKRSKIFKYTEFEGADHSINGKVLNNDEVYTWLFAQKRK